MTTFTAVLWWVKSHRIWHVDVLVFSVFILNESNIVNNMSKASYLKFGSKNLIIELDRLFYQSNISIEFHVLVKCKFVLQKMNALGDILCMFVVLSLENTTRISLYGFVLTFFVERFAVQIKIWSFICAEEQMML